MLCYALVEVHRGKRGWQMLAAALGCVIGLVGWSSTGAPTLFLIGAECIVAG